MSHWLFKTEPSEFSIDDLRNSPAQTARWDGIRNYQARNFIRDNIRKADTVWLYHSQTKPVGIVGRAKVVSPPYPDPAQWDPDSPYFDPKSQPDNPRWYCVDIQHLESFSRTITLTELKRIASLKDMVLLKQGRLSIQPVTETEAEILQQHLNVE